MKQSVQRLVIALCLGAGVSGAVVPATAAVVDIEIAPPAPRVEVVPPPRPGFVWAPGFWDYRRHGHVWVPGRWVAERPGFHWVPDRWEQRGPRWHHEPGHWER